MNDDFPTLERRLREITLRLGDPDLEYVLGGEGNTSVKTSNGRLIIKASGTSFLNPEFVVVDSSKAVNLIRHRVNPADIPQQMLAMVVSTQKTSLRPSKEVTFHAILTKYKWLIHTHPREIDGFVCSRAANEPSKRHRYLSLLEERTNGGIAWVPYAGLGIPLARAIQRSCEAYLRMRGVKPEAFFLQNHGLIVGGEDASVVTKATQRYVSAVAGLREEASSKMTEGELTFGGIKRVDYMPNSNLRILCAQLQDQFKVAYHISPIVTKLVHSCHGKVYVLSGNFAPEQLQYLGQRPAWVDYSESIDTLKQNIATTLKAYKEAFSSDPTITFIEGLGVLAFDCSRDVKTIFAFTEKSIDVLERTLPFGGPRYLTEEEEQAIFT